MSYFLEPELQGRQRSITIPYLFSVLSFYDIIRICLMSGRELELKKKKTGFHNSSFNIGMFFDIATICLMSILELELQKSQIRQNCLIQSVRFHNFTLSLPVQQNLGLMF